MRARLLALSLPLLACAQRVTAADAAVDLPTIDLPAVDLPVVDIPAVDVPDVVDAAPPSILITGLGGSTGFGPDSQCLHPSDDGSYGGPHAVEGAAPVAVDLTPAFPAGFPFYSNSLRAVYVNTNGNISFERPVALGTPVAFPVAGQAMIAPWWADVDTRGGGQPARNNICFALEPERFVVTWDRVGYHDRHDDRANTFQLVLTVEHQHCDNDAAGLDYPTFEFRYARCEWDAGDASGGVSALAGVDAGNRTNYVSLPQSRTPAILDLCHTTNVPDGPPGLFRFQIRSSGGCGGNI